MKRALYFLPAQGRPKPVLFGRLSITSWRENNTKINRGLQQHTDYESISTIERVALLDSSMDLTKLVVRLFLLFFSAVKRLSTKYRQAVFRNSPPADDTDGRRTDAFRP